MPSLFDCLFSCRLISGFFITCRALLIAFNFSSPSSLASLSASLRLSSAGDSSERSCKIGAPIMFKIHRPNVSEKSETTKLNENQNEKKTKIFSNISTQAPWCFTHTTNYQLKNAKLYLYNGNILYLLKLLEIPSAI